MGVKKRKHILSCVLLLGSYVFLAQGAKIDSLKKVLITAREDTNKVNTLNRLAWEYKYSNPDSSILFINNAIALAQKTGFKRGMASALRNKGGSNLNQGNYTDALKYYFESLKISEEIGDKAGIAITISNIGIVYWHQGDHPKALSYYFRALKIDEELGKKRGIAIDFGNIGIIYAEQHDYSKALDYFFRALKMNKEFGNKKGIALWLGNIGSIYYEQTNYHQALDYYLKAIKMCEELGDKSGVADNLANIGTVYFEQGESQKSKVKSDSLYSKALEYDFKALKLTQELGDKNHISGILGNIGAIYFKTGKFKEAEGYFKHSLALSNTIGDLEGVKEVSQNLSQLYDTTGRYKLALEHYKKYIAAGDSIANDENIKKQTHTEMQYEFDKKEAQTKAEQGKKDAITKIVIYSISGGLFLVLALAGFIFRSYQQKKKANVIITEQKAEVEKQKQLVEEKQKEILDSIHYAKRIQLSLQPTEKYIEKTLTKLQVK